MPDVPANHAQGSAPIVLDDDEAPIAKGVPKIIFTVAYVPAFNFEFEPGEEHRQYVSKIGEGREVFDMIQITGKGASTNFKIICHGCGLSKTFGYSRIREHIKDECSFSEVPAHFVDEYKNWIRTKLLAVHKRKGRDTNTAKARRAIAVVPQPTVKSMFMGVQTRRDRLLGVVAKGWIATNLASNSCENPGTRQMIFDLSQLKLEVNDLDDLNRKSLATRMVEEATKLQELSWKSFAIKCRKYG